ncbi:adenosylcobinamide-phosphate synthase CbiB [Marinobacter sp. SS5-14b]|uniref:adenosylcobinamide-phosphate synthase CbiB n=1 Tax=Marinobacter sp. SS5-14b TaxID=3050456 RepID=UPI0026DF6940|nr:adenosylcobinamide-phosphate synthase CbiB [Marinobacter sp. SS5-14b]
MDTFLVAVAVCLAAVLLDLVAGEPRRWHPLVGFGRGAAVLEHWLNRQPKQPGRSLAGGLLGVVLLTAPVVALIGLLPNVLHGGLWLAVQVIVLWSALSLRGLAEHGKAVSGALQQADGERARAAVGRIVSRDAAALSDSGVAAAATESMLENGADAVFASLFWFLVAGLPGVVLHRMINTLDAMWGYRNDRFLYFGRCAARLDDLMNWLPARLTAITYAVLGHTRLALRCWRSQAKTWDSPNAGPVMAAGAGALGVTLGGPAPYASGIKHRPLLGDGAAASAQTVDGAIALVRRGVWLWLLVLMALALALKGLWPGGAG